ncbi:hypothetical protein EDEG_01342 [Edhazardia aedis USNM 41457]|uniref:Uncharacterized protein n=1 Tax=Edhazardia aedis (strain USNM 41457) TaxID=1003232 RepID=J9DT36_EDHAE|nr:hypothetical protein EDEG_01342 [Edhazardia aedis USNM 41457]|eukprot:EJW04472.1 hypothetical protein EDEG_01342 [Edhazardia aedis USNM 41457]
MIKSNECEREYCRSHGSLDNNRIKNYLRVYEHSENPDTNNHKSTRFNFKSEDLENISKSMKFNDKPDFLEKYFELKGNHSEDQESKTGQTIIDFSHPSLDEIVKSSDEKNKRQSDNSITKENERNRRFSPIGEKKVVQKFGETTSCIPEDQGILEKDISEINSRFIVHANVQNTNILNDVGDKSYIKKDDGKKSPPPSKTLSITSSELNYMNLQIYESENNIKDSRIFSSTTCSQQADSIVNLGAFKINNSVCSKDDDKSVSSRDIELESEKYYFIGKKNCEKHSGDVFDIEKVMKFRNFLSEPKEVTESYGNKSNDTFNNSIKMIYDGNSNSNNGNTRKTNIFSSSSNINADSIKSISSANKSNSSNDRKSGDSQKNSTSNNRKTSNISYSTSNTNNTDNISSTSKAKITNNTSYISSIGIRPNQQKDSSFIPSSRTSVSEEENLNRKNMSIASEFDSAICEISNRKYEKLLNKLGDSLINIDCTSKEFHSYFNKDIKKTEYSIDSKNTISDINDCKKKYDKYKNSNETYKKIKKIPVMFKLTVRNLPVMNMRTINTEIITKTKQQILTKMRKKNTIKLNTEIRSMRM